jgi:hypothetical protein
MNGTTTDRCIADERIFELVVERRTSSTEKQAEIDQMLRESGITLTQNMHGTSWRRDVGGSTNPPAIVE